MGFSVGDVTKAVSRGEHDLAREIGKTLIDGGHEASDLIRSTLNRLPGGFHAGSKLLGGGRPHRTIAQPFDPNFDMKAPSPGDIHVIGDKITNSCGNSAWDGRQAFPLVGFKALAAGALTQGTDLVNFHAAASNPTWITADNLIPGNVEVYETSLYITARLTTTLGFEGQGFFNSFWLIEYINSIEKNRWSMRKLKAMTGATGIVTSGAAMGAQVAIPSIPWHRKYDPTTPYKTALQLSVTTTTVSILDCAFPEEGVHP